MVPGGRRWGWSCTILLAYQKKAEAPYTGIFLLGGLRSRPLFRSCESSFWTRQRISRRNNGLGRSVVWKGGTVWVGFGQHGKLLFFSIIFLSLYYTPTTALLLLYKHMHWTARNFCLLSIIFIVFIFWAILDPFILSNVHVRTFLVSIKLLLFVTGKLSYSSKQRKEGEKERKRRRAHRYLLPPPHVFLLCHKHRFTGVLENKKR